MRGKLRAARKQTLESGDPFSDRFLCRPLDFSSEVQNPFISNGRESPYRCGLRPPRDDRKTFECAGWDPNQNPNSEWVGESLPYFSPYVRSLWLQFHQKGTSPGARVTEALRLRATTRVSDRIPEVGSVSSK